nr:hypothetical protein [uncultured Methanobrevibacter sp.]
MSNKSKKELENDLKECDEEIKKLQNRLTDLLNIMSIEYIDLYEFINELDTLKSRKNKIKYLLAVDV